MGSTWKRTPLSISKIYPDGYKFYMHYRNGNGKPLIYNYAKAIKDDSDIRNYVNNFVKSFIKYVDKQKLGVDKTYAYSSKLDVDIGVTPKTPNWILAIGTNLVALTSEVNMNKTGKITAKILIVAFDRYNFSSSKNFAGIIPGSWNGELVTCGMAKNYTSADYAYCSFSWRKGKCINVGSFTYFY